MIANLHSVPTNAPLKRMCAAGQMPRAGSHCSDGMRVDRHRHYHDMHQLLYAFEGAIEVESTRGRHLIPRQLAAWIPAGTPHATRIQGVRSGSVFFPAGWVRNPGTHVRTILASSLMREMIRESMRWPFLEPENATGKAFFGAMAQLCEDWIQQDTELYLPMGSDQRLRRALEFTHAQASASLAEVCGRIGVSERSLRRHLKEQIGMTWEDFRRRSRLLRAIALLSDTDLAISEVAARCGFESQSAFAKAFRGAMNVSPTDYRAKTRDPL